MDKLGKSAFWRVVGGVSIYIYIYIYIHTVCTAVSVAYLQKYDTNLPVGARPGWAPAAGRPQKKELEAMPTSASEAAGSGEDAPKREYIHVYACIHTYIYTCVYTCKHTCVYIYIYTYTYV